MELTALLIDNPNEINRRIHAIEAERTKLHQNTTSNDFDSTRANDLSSNLQLAINNNDLDTLNALIVENGEVPSLLKLKELIGLKQSLEQQRLLQIQIDDVKTDLTNIDSFNYDQLQQIKTKLDTLNNEELNTEFKLIVEAFKSTLVADFKEEQTPSNFTNLVNLQLLVEPSASWAFDIIALKFKTSFDYHFNSNSETNRIEKPELFFNYHLNYLNQHILTINKKWSDERIESYSEFIDSSLKPVKDKISKTLTILRSDSNGKTSVDILIHLINEILKFDDKLINEFYYDSKLISLLSYEDLEKWLLREVEINLNNFETIVNSSNCFHIDYTSVNSIELKPTYSSIKLKILFENLNKNFSKVFKIQYESISQLNTFKLKYFAKIYLTLLGRYLERLTDGYKAFNELFKSNSKSKEIDISGVNGLERIFRLYCSSKFISNSLSLWDQEFIFNELHYLFNKFSDYKTPTLFHSYLKDYNDLNKKTWDLLLNFLSKDIKNLFKNYKFNDENNVGLLPLIDKLNEYCSFISKILPQRQFEQLNNQISLQIGEYFFGSVIKTNYFSSPTINQLSLDINNIWNKLNLSTNFPCYYKLIEALQILSLSDIQIKQFTNLSLNQYAKLGDYKELKEFLSIGYLNDNDILDILLRIK